MFMVATRAAICSEDWCHTVPCHLIWRRAGLEQNSAAGLRVRLKTHPLVASPVGALAIEAAVRLALAAAADLEGIRLGAMPARREESRDSR